MDALAVRKVAVRCRLTREHVGDRPRILRAFRGGMAPALDRALVAAGIAPREEICIRRLVVPARLWVGLTDEAVLEAWASAVIAQVRRALDHGDAEGVVRYRSSIEAVVDAVRGTARRTTARRWAWRQLGVPDTGAPAAAIVHLLLRNPDAIVLAFRILADDPAFVATVRGMDDDRLAALAEAALAHAGHAVSLRDALDRARIVSDLLSGDGERIRLVAKRSPVVPWARRPRSPLGDVAAGALALLEAEPALVRGSVTDIARVLATMCIAMDAARAAAPMEREAADAAAPRADAREPGREHVSVDGMSALSRADDRRDPEPTDDGARVRLAPASAARRPYNAAWSRRHAAADAQASASARADDGPLDLRRRAFTDWAGLLFLINVAREIALADRVLDESALGQRPLSWVLRQIAVAVVPASPTDAAVRAFAGLPPADAAADHEDDEPCEAERPALRTLAGLLTAATCSRLDRPPSDQPVHELCARRGEIVADPGWIEVRLSLASVSTDVRRAGLDVDPGHVEWLGIVVQVSYV